MKIFAFEYTSAGGMQQQPVATPLARQGAAMRRALLGDLAELSDIELITLEHGAAPEAGPDTPVRLSHDAPWRHFRDCIQQADAVWLVAPESDRILEDLSWQVLAAGRRLLGSSPAAVRLASSKLHTARLLSGAGIAAVATFAPRDVLPPDAPAWVVKPAYGAGCVDTHIFPDSQAALAWIAGRPAAYVLQPFIIGQPCSLTLLCCDGRAQLLSCNEQRVAVRDGQFHFMGSTVNGLRDKTGQLDRLAQSIAAAMPGLWGYVGIDFILSRQGPVVLEVNPRMTTSCAGLRASLGRNPAHMVLGLLPGMPVTGSTPFGPVAVSVDVNPFD